MPDKQELINQLINIEYIPDITLISYDVEKLPSFPIDYLAGIASAFKPIADLVANQTATGGSGVYYVKTKGREMFKSTGGFIGSLKDDNGAVGGGQARMISIQVDPASLAASGTVMAIEHKLNNIVDNLKGIEDFLLLQEQAKIKGNINTLVDILNNYKYNVENDKYKNNKHILVQSIKNETEKSLILTESLLEKLLNKKFGIQFDKDVSNSLKSFIERLNDFQLGVYQLSFSSFLEMILLENFDFNYIDSILNTISNYKIKYQELCIKVKEKIKQLSEGSVQNTLMGGMLKLSKGMGKLIEKTPLSKTQIDEKLISGGEKISEIMKKFVNSKVEVLSDNNIDLVEPFEKIIKTVKLIYKGEYGLIFDSENIYLDLDL